MKRNTKAKHDYAIKTNSRRTATLACLAVAFLLSLFIDRITPAVKQAVIDLLTSWSWDGVLDDWRFKAALQLAKYLLPISEFAFVYFVYDKFAWKWPLCRKLHKIPNLNGTWKAKAFSPLKGEMSEITMTIRQDWNKLHVEGISTSGTRTDSYTASIIVGCRNSDSEAVTFSYAYNITTYRPKQDDVFEKGDTEIEQTYPGFNSLIYDSEKGVLEGDYFSNKDIVLRKDSAFMNYVARIPNSEELIRYLKGCGSKGQIWMVREPQKCLKERG